MEGNIIALIFLVLFCGTVYCAYQTMLDAHNDKENRKISQQCPKCGEWYGYEDNCHNCGGGC